jgi:hypothetical protein
VYEYQAEEMGIRWKIAERWCNAQKNDVQRGQVTGKGTTICTVKILFRLGVHYIEVYLQQNRSGGLRHVFEDEVFIIHRCSLREVLLYI